MMRSAPLEFDFTPKKWCSFDDVEILKKAGDINIDTMRLIILMYPEYQINKKKLEERSRLMRRFATRWQRNNNDLENIINRDCYC